MFLIGRSVNEIFFFFFLSMENYELIGEEYEWVFSFSPCVFVPALSVGLKIALFVRNSVPRSPIDFMTEQDEQVSDTDDV